MVCHCCSRSLIKIMGLCCRVWMSSKGNFRFHTSRRHISCSLGAPIPNSEINPGTSLRLLFCLNVNNWSHSLREYMKNSLVWVWAALASTSWSIYDIFPSFYVYWWETRHNWSYGLPSAETTAQACGLHQKLAHSFIPQRVIATLLLY